MKQCRFISPHLPRGRDEDGGMCCRYERGHSGPHRTGYDLQPGGEESLQWELRPNVTTEEIQEAVRSICKRWFDDYGQDAVPWVQRLMDAPEFAE